MSEILGNVENLGSGAKITSRDLGVKRNGEIRIYRPKKQRDYSKNNVINVDGFDLKLVNTLPAGGPAEVDYMGQKVVFDPEKINIRLRDGKKPVKFNCRDCGVEGMKTHIRTTRCRPCQKKCDSQRRKVDHDRRKKEELRDGRNTTTK